MDPSDKCRRPTRCSAVGSVRALGAWGRRFESCHLDQKKSPQSLGLRALLLSYHASEDDVRRRGEYAVWCAVRLLRLIVCVGCLVVEVECFDKILEVFVGTRLEDLPAVVESTVRDVFRIGMIIADDR